jgi:hypothetical protein
MSSRLLAIGDGAAEGVEQDHRAWRTAVPTAWLLPVDGDDDWAVEATLKPRKARAAQPNVR